MKNFNVALSVAVAGSAFLQAQEVKSTTTVKADDAKTVVYSGCVRTGTEAKSFVLESAVPLKQMTTQTNVARSGSGSTVTTTTTTTSYVLVPDEKVDLAMNIGRKVEVTAVEIPRGDGRTTIETKTKTEVKGQEALETQVKEKIPQKDWAQLRVVSVKHLEERCQP
jgi:hypothetical protein